MITINELKTLHVKPEYIEMRHIKILMTSADQDLLRSRMTSLMDVGHSVTNHQNIQRHECKYQYSEVPIIRPPMVLVESGFNL